jgi:diadenosine tetraphosphate (Ap4A) HIT family hydrolase
MKTVLMKLEICLERPAYNYIIHTSPFDTQSLPHYHWHIEVIPRLTRVAGFEWGRASTSIPSRRSRPRRCSVIRPLMSAEVGRLEWNKARSPSFMFSAPSRHLRFRL